MIATCIHGVKLKGLKQDLISKILINDAHTSLQGLVVRDRQLLKPSYMDFELQEKQKLTTNAIEKELSSNGICFKFVEERHCVIHPNILQSRSREEDRTAAGPGYSDEDDDNNQLRDESEMVYDFDSPNSPKQSSILKVSKLLDNYLAELALDSNLTSQEASSHAAQNERLHVQMAAQVLYFEQIRLQNAMNEGHNQFFFGSLNDHFPQRSSSGAGSRAISPRDNYVSVRRENGELKLEVVRMRMRLTDLEKDHVCMKKELVRSHLANKLFKSFAKKLRKLDALLRINSIKPHPPSKANSESRFFLPKHRHHSIS
ncbi:hypothetical protein Ancab_019333 [Ancistrocladus abbreviatus]